MKLFLLVFKNLRRNKVRSMLTALAVMLLVAIFSMIATVINFIEEFTSEKSRDIRLLVTERYRIPSRFDYAFVDQIIRPGGTLNNQLSQIHGFHADKCTVWQFVAFTLDPELKDKEKSFLAIATIPEKVPEMMQVELKGVKPEVCQKMVQLMKNPPSELPNIGLLMGSELLKKLKLHVGDKIEPLSVSHQEGTGTHAHIKMKFEIIGMIPPESPWSAFTLMDHEYLARELKRTKNQDDGKVNIALLMVDDQASANQVSQAIEGNFRELKCETFSAAIQRFLEPQKDFFNGLKYFVAPAIVIVITVIVANAISITVRERNTEMAVLKILGFSRRQILALVLGEGVVVGILGGLVGGGLTHTITHLVGGLRIGDGAPFFVSPKAWWWGPALGAITALVAGLIPAWNACRIKVSEVFARVA